MKKATPALPVFVRKPDVRRMLGGMSLSPITLSDGLAGAAFEGRPGDQARPRPGSRQRAVVLVAVKAEPSVAAEERPALTATARVGVWMKRPGRRKGLRKGPNQGRWRKREGRSGGEASGFRAQQRQLDIHGAADGLPTTASRTL